MFRRVLFIGLLACLLVGVSSAYLAGYGYYQDATVNNTGSNLTNYQVMFTVNTSSGTSSGTTLYLNSHSEVDLDDLRFTDTSDNLYDYWIESTASPYNVWVEVPSITTGNTTVRVQYGNAGASAASNGTNTFSFFDDFSAGSLNTTLWYAPSSYTISGGLIKLDPAAEYSNGLASKTKQNVTANILRGRHNTTDCTKGWTYRFSFGFGNDRSYTSGYHHAGFTFGFTTTDARLGTVLHGSGWNTPSISSVANNNNFYISELRKSGSTVYITSIDSDGTSGSTSSGSYTDSDDTNYIMGNGNIGGSTTYIDFILLRTYTATAPTVPAWVAESAIMVAPVAAFSGNVTSGVQPLTVLFTDASTNTPTSWAWSFDDGGANDTNQNPTRTFDDVGLYTITLTATNDAGSDSEEKVDYINVTSGAPVAAFSANRTTGGPGDVLFTDSSTNTPTAWAWSWGDGTANGTTQNPTHTYAAGTWTVTLTATNVYGSDSEVKTDYITITNPPVAAFHANVTSGAAPLTVLFTDTSTNTPTSWAWDVNYNSATDYVTQNATHTYAAAGTYSVRLNATNAGGSDDEIKNNYIVVYTLYPFPGCSAAPTDIDADGYYEDINGNARLDWSDLILFFTHLTWAKNTEPNALFDFANDGGTITYSDVNALYPEVSAAV